MKIAALVAAVLAAIVFGVLLRGRPKFHPPLLFALAFLLWFGPERLGFYLAWDAIYRGDTRGYGFTAIDILALALFIALPRSGRSARVWLVAGPYVACCWLSMSFAEIPRYAAFSAWTAVRSILAAIVVARACARPLMLTVWVQGIACGMIYELGSALWQRYGQGAHQIHGTFGHQNSLGMAVNLFAPLLFAAALSRRSGILAMAGLAGGATCTVLSLSRGSLSLLPVLLFVVYAQSLISQVSGRKLALGLLGGFGVTAIIIPSLDSIIGRFFAAPDASEEARLKFIEAAGLILKDHPQGIGLNQFSNVLSLGGYWEAVHLPRMDSTGIVHHIYWLTAVELGWIGLVLYGVLVAWPLLLAARRSWGRISDSRSGLLLGCAAGLCGLATQGTLEWAVRQTTLSYMFFIQTGLTLELCRQLRDARRQAAMHRSAPRGEPS